MTGTPGQRSRSAATIAALGAITQRSNCSGLSPPAQLSNSCTASTPGVDLAGQIVDRQCNDRRDQFAKGTGIAVRQRACRLLGLRSLPLDHVDRDRPRRACEARGRWSLPPAPARRLVPSHRPAPAAPARPAARQGTRRPAPAPAAAPRPRRSSAPAPSPKAPSGCRKTGSHRRSRTGVPAAASPPPPPPDRWPAPGTPALLGPQRAVFRQVTPGLPHQPYRRTRLSGAVQGREQWLGGRIGQGVRLLLLKKSLERGCGGCWHVRGGAYAFAPRLPTA